MPHAVEVSSVKRPELVMHIAWFMLSNLSSLVVYIVDMIHDKVLV